MTERIEGLAAQDSQDDIFIANAPPAPLSTRMAPVALVGLRSPCATGAVVQRKARFLHVRLCLQISQSGVTINRAPDQVVKLPFDFAFMWCMLSLVMCRSGSGSYLEFVQ